MADAPVRVALLARAGEAREQLRRALQDLGASIVAEGDPNELDPAQVKAQAPGVVLVSLEPTVEDALDRFADLLAMPNVEVMYDDADVTSKLEGWDLARWARHLAAKLVGSDLLPPPPAEGTGSEEEVMISPGLPPTPAQLMDDAKLEDYTLDTAAMAEGVPATEALTDLPGGMSDSDGDTDLPLPSVGFDLDLSDVEQALSRMDAETGGKLPTASDESDVPAATENLDEFNMDLDLGQLNAMLGKDEPAPAKLDTALPPTLADLDFDTDKPTKFSSFSDSAEEGGELALDDDLAALAAAMEANAPTTAGEEVKDPDFAIAFDDDDKTEEPAKPEPPSTKAKFNTGRNDPQPPPKVAKPSFDLSGLSLEEMNDNPAINKAQIEAEKVRSGLLDKIGFSLEAMSEESDEAPPPPAPVAAAVPPPALMKKASGLSLEAMADDSDAPVANFSGALLVLAGMGGPDAVRQLLGSLPANLPVPVLLYQHLEVGKHDRLVGQLAKVSSLPVYLAEEGKAVRPGQVAVLSAGMGVDKGGHHFAPVLSLAALINAVPAEDSALVVLSGADPGIAHAAKTMHSHGGTVHAQEPASCFEPAASQALTAAGILAYAPHELAKHTCKRWM